MRTPLLLICICLCIFTSCNTEPEPFVTIRSEVYNQLATETNSELDSMITKVASIEKLQEFNTAVKVIHTKDEMEIISAIIDTSIEEEINIDSLKMTENNTLFIHNKNNVNYDSFRKTNAQRARTGYSLKFPTSTYDTRNAKEIWEEAMQKKSSIAVMDSITMSEKVRIESRYHKGLNQLKEIDYVVLVHDALLIPPVLDATNKEFISGYILTHAFVYDFKTLERIEQKMIISSNGDQISFYTTSSSTRVNELSLEGKIRNDLINKKNIAVDSTFRFNR
ncbi:hypothetical protein IMCC3317_06210 [Kordia antarctica]|uniref:Lipoprotein n=1 Tax=Kordia antarctica TaxID=1218801 RepID=A0A7L4ZF96_9FLAO|nr:hypothetical protein [Kordia antarctica]QHI35275.1 hypothetical protein IMCC3317_06210 [Kordia antarctica]